MNTDLIIKDASKAQLEDMKLQIDKQLAELNKPKQYVFKEGDFEISILDEKPMWRTSGVFDKWMQSFSFLSYHCLKLGGRVMSKPNDRGYWHRPFYSTANNKFDVIHDNTIDGLFHFYNESRAKQFLSTEGVQEHLYNFFQIEKPKKD